MASISPAQRRVLEAAQRGDLLHVFDEIYFAYDRPGPGRRNVTSDAETMVAVGFIEHGRPWGLSSHDAVLTPAGQAELGITDTEEN